MSFITNVAQTKLPSIHCKSLTSLIRNCVTTPSDLNSEDESTCYDLHTKHMILKELRSRARRAGTKRNELFYSANLSLSFFPPSINNIIAQEEEEEFEENGDNEDESDAFFSVKSNFSHSCSSQGATASWDANRGGAAAAARRSSALEEFKHLDGWPFGLCRRPLVLPPLPSIPADSWMWCGRNSEAKSAGVAT